MKNLTKYIKNNWYPFAIFAILLVASLLRFYQLGIIPHGMTWDEAAIGYNGFSVLTTRRDEWLDRMPISFMSFGDYKAPFAIYLNGIFTYLFGMNLFAVRLPFTIVSILAILGIILLTENIFQKNKLGKYYALFAGFLLTFSPWHIHYSRAGFESGMALGFVIWAVFFLHKSLLNGFKKRADLFASVILFILSIYTYHSAKIVVPLIGLLFLVTYFKEIKSRIKLLIFPLILFVVGLVPFIYDSLAGEGLTRAGVTVFSSDMGFVQKISYVVRSFLLHTTPDFLLIGETTTLRHGVGYLGVLFFTTYILVAAGIVAVLKDRKNKLNKERLFYLSVAAIGIVPAAVAMEVPHSNRALLALFGIIITAVFGFDFLINTLKETRLNKTVSGSHNEDNILVKSFVGTLIALHMIFAVSFINYYFNDFKKLSTDAFNDGYLEAFELAEKYEKGEGTQPVDKVIFTSKYGQPYIYAIFVRKTNPIWYRGGSLIKYEFYDQITIDDLSRKNTLVVGSGTDESLPTEKADHIIYGADGSVRFQMFRTK